MKLIIATVMLAMLSACSSTGPTKTYQGNAPTNTVRNVIGVGTTFDEAKNNGFAVAVEKAVGSVILVDKEVRNDKLVRDDILSHSAGYVDDYTIISQSNTQGKVIVVMDVDVKHSKIAEKMLNRNASPTDLQGNKLNTQYKTYLVERGTGDQLLNNILKDYPSKALTATPGKIDFMVSSHRQPVIVIPYQIKWNYSYIEAMNEALKTLEDGTEANYFNAKCMCYKAPERVVVMAKDPKAWLLGSKNNYYFNDSMRVDHIRNAFDGGTNIRVSVFDGGNTVIHSQCFKVGTVFAGRMDRNLFTVWGNETEEGVLHVTVNNDKSLGKNLSTANKIELSMDTNRGCRH
jgi:hypothetical protein